MAQGEWTDAATRHSCLDSHQNRHHGRRWSPWSASTSHLIIPNERENPLHAPLLAACIRALQVDVER